jgi:hypothetical protein
VRAVLHKELAGPQSDKLLGQFYLRSLSGGRPANSFRENSRAKSA